MASLFDNEGITPEKVESVVNDYKTKYKALRTLINNFRDGLPSKLADVANFEADYADYMAVLDQYPAFKAEYDLYKGPADALVAGVATLIAEQEASAG